MGPVGVEEQGFGSLLRALREAGGLSQEELAARAGLSSHAVSALERGARTRPYPHTIRSLADAEISWWVVDECVGTDLEAALDELVPRWIAESWPLSAPRYVGRDLTWDEWLALPELPAPGPSGTQ